MASASVRSCSRRRSLRGLSFAALGLLAGAAQARAQAPFLNLGIYGGVPQISASAVKYTSVRLMRAGLTPSTIPFAYSITLPLNGQQNYSFYYQPFLPLAVSSGAALNGASAASVEEASPVSDAASNNLFYPAPPEPLYGPSGFLPAGTYDVSYLDAAGHSKAAGTVTYKPNAGYTNGAVVPNNPPNFGLTTIAAAPLGIQGTVTVTIGPVSPAAQARPVQGVTVQLLSALTGKLLATVPTNGNGFYSFYYAYGSKPGFIPPGKYFVRATLFGIPLTDAVTYAPNTDATSPGYYVTGARAVANFVFAQP